MATTNGLTKSAIDIPLTGGIDRKTDPKQLQPGQMYTCDNIQYIGEKQLRKRYGFNVLSPPGSLQGAPFAAVGCRDNIEPVILGSGALNRYNTQTGLSTYISANTQGRFSSLPITSSSGIGTYASPPIDSTCATDGQKYICVAYQEPQTNTSTVFYGVQDIQTGSWITAPVSISSATSSFTAGSNTYTVNGITGPRVVYSSGYFYIIYSALASYTSGSTTTYATQLQAYALSLTNLAAGVTATNLALTVSSAGTSSQGAYLGYGFAATVYNSILYIATPNTSTPGSGTVTSYSTSGTTLTQTASGAYTGYNYGSGYFTRLGLAVNGTYVGVVTSSSFIAMTMALSQTLRIDYNSASYGSAIMASPPTLVWNGNTAYAFWPVQLSAIQTILCYAIKPATSTTTAIIGVSAPSLSGLAAILSKPFVYNNKVYLWIFTQGYGSFATYRSQVLAEYDTNNNKINYVARTAYQAAAIIADDIVAPTEVINIPNTSQFVTFLSQTTDEVAPTNFYGTLNRATFDFAPTSLPRLHSLPTGGLLVAGAFPLYYDGQSLNEAGYTNAPDFAILGGSTATAPVTRTSGGSILAGTYNYYACYVRRDAYGNVIRSAPSNAYTITTTGTTSCVIFPPITYVGQSNVYIEYYRTTIASPSEPYFVAKVAVGSSFTDVSADSSITSNANLYTYSGEYPNDPTPPVHSMAIGETRAYIIPSDARNVIWCSKKYTPERTVEWTSNLVLSEGGTHNGQFTAIAVMDTNVIVFKRDSIIYFYGDGPDNTGATGSFSAFQKLTSDVGCIDPNSIAIIPAGILFRSLRGIELLSRGLQVSYVGFPVEPLVQAITTIASTCVLPQYQQVRFVPNVAGQPVLVYDYLANRWSTYSNMAALACANVQGNYWWISQDGTTCNVETPGAFLDNNTNITMTVVTPEIPMSTIQGWGRLYRFALLGEYKSTHTMVVSFAYDHADVYTDNIYYSVLDTAAAYIVPTGVTVNDAETNNPVDIVTLPCPMQFRMSRVPRQVMQTVRIMLQDTPFNGYYISDGVQVTPTFTFAESCAISNITLEVGQKAIIAKLTGTKTV